MSLQKEFSICLREAYQNTQNASFSLGGDMVVSQQKSDYVHVNSYTRKRSEIEVGLSLLLCSLVFQFTVKKFGSITISLVVYMNYALC